MKRFVLLLVSFVLLFVCCACSASDSVIDSLPAYESEAFYTSGGVQDSTDYAKYTYKSITVRDLESSPYFLAVTDDDVEDILLHIDNFEEWVETIGRDLKANYDFDKSVISEGDFVYIKTKAGEPIGQSTYGKYDNYTVYYFDISESILYYFHNNI